jgi:hypothetical protein
MRLWPSRSFVLVAFLAVASSGCAPSVRLDEMPVESWRKSLFDERTLGSRWFDVIAMRFPASDLTVANLSAVTPSWCASRMRLPGGQTLCEFHGWAQAIQLEVEPFPCWHSNSMYDAFDVGITDLGEEGTRLEIKPRQGAPIVGERTLVMSANDSFVALETPGLIRVSAEKPRFAKCLYVILVRRGEP